MQKDKGSILDESGGQSKGNEVGTCLPIYAGDDNLIMAKRSPVRSHGITQDSSYEHQEGL